jgi:hypothetical protein
LPLVRKPIQKELAIAFREALLPPSLEALLTSRYVKHFAPLFEDGFTPDWNELLSCLRSA